MYKFRELDRSHMRELINKSAQIDSEIAMIVTDVHKSGNVPL